ncbi:2,3-diaminopropionate biosynthesis protein SbnA [Streptomyces sp. YIM 98790]|uniref:2,3-diaminopropionate biosynthesis protein SbnA n=1 Tax=Streptomyces sp. YIM 98790 TaxID=2689077 RepID=UPI001408B133|nr:2,3-diaminopropionate biosynthesis protein SbnA [Streptomyces sp. YIM 98790]
MIANEAHDLVVEDVFLRIDEYVPGSSGFLKIEACNPAGSIKIKTAVALVEEAEKAGCIRPRTRLIESTSGNLGIALSVICAAKGYPLTCVTDPNTNAQSIRMMEALGTEVVVISRRDRNGGYLNSRIEYIRLRMLRDPTLHWLNQYANPAGVEAHRARTGRAVVEQFDRVDELFIAAGTTGTLMGCASYLRQHSPRTRIVAVDVEGSVIFGGPPGRRCVPGMGASRRPEILDETLTDQVVVVSEADTVQACRALAKERGLLAGGSTGSVLAALRRESRRIPHGSVVVAISPDLGMHYLDTIYDDEWVARRWPHLLAAGTPAPAAKDVSRV